MTIAFKVNIIRFVNDTPVQFIGPAHMQCKYVCKCIVDTRDFLYTALIYVRYTLCLYI